MYIPQQIESTHLKIGYFIHRLVRHDTVEDTTYTRRFLPHNSPIFQQDQTTIWGGSSNLKRSTGVVTISTRPEDAKEMTTILEQTFKNQKNMLFISKLYFNSLDTIQRLQYVESQIQYTKTHRSIIFRDIQETHVPTTIYKDDNITQMILTEWITKIQDYQGRPLYLQVFPPVHDIVEAHILTTNVSLAYEWERDCKSHIAKVMDKHEYNSVFDIPIEDQQLIIPSKEIWAVTPAPTIEFLVPQRKAVWKSPIPQTIQNQNNNVASDTKSTTCITSKQKQTKINNNDTNTIITTTTYNSENISVNYRMKAVNILSTLKITNIA
jgi:hypothetical protein